MTVVIPLNKGYEAIIDDEDYPIIAGYTWRCRFSKSKFSKLVYAEANITNSKIVYMHRMIFSAPDGMEIDHINRNGIDNRRGNLRVATRSQNTANRRYANSTGFSGVVKMRYKFYGKLTVLGKIYLTSGFNNPLDAAMARDSLALQYFGEFAHLNFPNDVQSLEERPARDATQISGSVPPSTNHITLRQKPQTSMPLFVTTAIGTNQ